MADEQTIAPPPETGEPQPAPAPPQDQGGQPPAARKLYDQLNKSQLYTKSFEDFQQQFSKPDAINKLYQNLNGAKLYTKSKDDFYNQFFQENKPPPEHEISHTPVQDIRHLNDLANQPIRSTTTSLDPTSGGSMTDFNQEDIARNKDFQDKYEKSITDLAGTWGTDPKATKQAIQDFPGEPDENKLKGFAGMAQNNPVYYSRLKSANDIRMTIAQSGPDGVNDANVFNHLQTADNYEQLQHNIAMQQEIMHKHGLGQAYFEKLKESQAPLINTLDPGLHIQYWNSEDKKLGLSDFQYAGLETDKLFYPGKYKQERAIIEHNRGLDQGSEPVAIPQGKEGYAYDRGVENVLFALEHQGRDNTGKYISQRTAEIGPQIDGLVQKYKDYIGTTADPLLQQHFQQEFHNDPLLQEAAKIDEGQQAIEYARTEDQRRFPLNYGDQSSRLVKDAMSGTNGWAGVAGKQLLLGAGESSDNTMRFIKNTYINLLGSEQAKAENAAANIGHQSLTQLAGYEGSAFSQQQSPLIIDKGLVDKIQQTFNDGALSVEQKNKKATDLILNNEGAIKANPSAGQQNLTGKAVIYSAANTIGQILGIADQSLLMGGLMGDASKAQQMASAVVPMYASTQNQLYEQALARGDEKPLLSSHIDAAIISLASLINPDIKVVKGMVGAETGIGKLIAGVDESTWNKVLSTNKPLMDRMIAGTKATARQLGLANLQYGLIVPTAQYIVHKNILNEDPNLGDALKDGLLQTNISMALPALLHGVWGGVNATKVNPMQKFAIVEAGLHPKENVELIDQLVEKGQVTPDRADQIKEVIKQSGQILEHTEAVKSDGAWMNEHEVADLTYQMLRKKVLEGKLKNAPDPQKPAIEAKIHEVNQSIADLHTSDEHKQKSELNQLLTDNLDRIRDKIQPMESSVKEAIKRNEPESVFKEIYDQASQTTNIEGKEVSARAATEETFGKALVEKAYELHKQKPEKSAIPPTEEQATEKPNEGAASETTGAVEPAASSFLQSRHADTIHDEQGIVSGPNNKELSPKGKRDANDLAKDVEGKGVTTIITSGLERSKETGDKVAEKIGAKVENRPALDTWNIKDFDGLKDDEFKDVQQWFVENPDNTVYQGPLEKYKGKEVAESVNEYAHRIIPEMEKIEKESGPETLLINHSNNMMLWDAYLKNGREWNAQAREDYLTSEKPEAATLTNKTQDNVAGETGGTGEGQEPPNGAGGAPVVTGEPSKTGIAERVKRDREAAAGVKAPSPGKGTSLEDLIKRGRQLLKDGADPEKVIEDFEKDKKINADAVGLVRAKLEQLAKATDAAVEKYGDRSEEADAARKAESDWAARIQPLQTESSDIFRAQQGDTDLDTGTVTSIKRAFEEQSGKPLTEKQAEVAKGLRSKIQEHETTIAAQQKELNALHDREANKSATSFITKTKQAADIFRKLKTKEFTFKDSNGNDVPIYKMGISYNDLIELGAKAIEKTGEIADGVAAIIDKVKEADWYKALSKQDQDRFGKELEDHYIGIADRKTASRIKALEKQLSDLQEGKVKSKTDRKPTAREQELKDQIFDEKQRLGLVRPKGTPTPKTPISKPKIDIATHFIDKRDNQFTPDEAKAVWKHTQKVMDSGKTDFHDVINQVAMDTGLSSEQVRRAIAEPKGAKVVTDRMYAAMYKRNQVVQAARAWVKSADESAAKKFWKAAIAGPSAIVTFGHGSVAPITHVGTDLYRPSNWKSYFNFMLNSYKYSFGGLTDKGKATYENAMADLIRDPMFTMAKRAGLKIDPTDLSGDDYSKYQSVFGKIAKMGERGFNAMKPYRLEQFKKEYNKLSDQAKGNAEVLKSIAQGVNLSSGTTDAKIPPGTDAVFFAPKLVTSQYQRIFTEPAKAMHTFATWDKSTDAQKVQAKMVARHSGEMVATYMTLLAGNAAILSMTGSKQKINFDSPLDSDWMKYKVAGKTVDASGGMNSALRFIASLVHEGARANGIIKTNAKGKPGDTEGKKVLQQLTNKLSPAAGDVVEGFSGTDMLGNPLPWSSVKPTATKPRLSWSEYMSTKLPIPIAEGIKTFNDAAKEQGMPKTTLDNILEGFLIGGLTGTTGGKIGPDYSPEKKETGRTGRTGGHTR